MSTSDWIPSDDALLAFDQGRLPEAEIDAVAKWLETTPGAEERIRRVVGEAVDFTASALREQCGIHDEIAKLSHVTEQVIDGVARVRTSRILGAKAEVRDTSAKPARIIRDYELLRQIGRGGMGQVFLARHLRLRRDVALKLLPAHLAANPEYRGRFERETAALGQMDHPNLVRAYDAGADGPNLFLVMELLDGQDLDTLVRKSGPLPIADACEVIRQAALGLNCAHQHGMIHRDIKPSNLILTTSGVIKVIDLGLARVLDPKLAEQTFSSQLAVIGTPMYMAPEQWTSTKVDCRADIYSLGCTLYCLLTGDPPFLPDEGDRTWVAMLDAHRHSPPPAVRERRPDVPVSLARLMDRMLAKDLKDRPATAAEVAEALTPFAAGHQLPATPVLAPSRSQQTPLVRAAPTATRRPVKAAMAIGLLAVVAGGAVVAVASLRPFGTTAAGQSAGASSPSIPETSTVAAGTVVLQPSKTLIGHGNWIRALAFSPDGKVLASGSLDWTIVLWNTADWTPRVRIPGHGMEVFGLAFSADSRKLASTRMGTDDCAIRLYDVDSRAPDGTVGGPWAGLYAVAWMPDGKTLVTAGVDNQLSFWDIATGQHESIKTVCSRHVRGLSISPDKKLIATGGSGPTRIWDLATRKEIPSQLPPDLCPIFLPPDGTQVAGWDHGHGTVSVCNLVSGKVRTWRAHTEYTEGLAVSPDGRFLASVGFEGIGYIWSVADGARLATLVGHVGAVGDVAFAPDGKQLATCGHEDHSIRIWDLSAVCHVPSKSK